MKLVRRQNRTGEVFVCLVEQVGKVLWQALLCPVGIAAEEDHNREGILPTKKEVYQVGLIDPIDLSH